MSSSHSVTLKSIGHTCTLNGFFFSPIFTHPLKGSEDSQGPTDHTLEIAGLRDAGQELQGGCPSWDVGRDTEAEGTSWGQP